MRTLKNIFVLLLALFILSIVYAGMAWSFAPWYDGINMETPYSVSYYQNRINEIVKKFADEPLNVTSFSMTEDECEGFLKLALQMNSSVIDVVDGVDLTIQKKLIVIKANLQLPSNKRGIEITIEPYMEEKKRELTLKVNRIKLGDYPIPVFPVLYVVEKMIPREGPLKIESGRIRININELPVALKYVRIESKQVIAGLSMGISLSNKSTENKTLIQEVFKKADVLKKGVSSMQIKEYISEMQNKDEVISEDIDKAKAIYNSLTAEDKEILHQNLKEFLRDPTINEALRELGLL
jgi:uncharacterized protein YpmS